MSGYHIFKRQGFPAYLGFVCCALLIMFLVGCGDESANSATTDKVTSDAAGTGSVSLSIQWQMDPKVSYSADALIRQAIDDCSSAGVSFITTEVYDESNNPIASGGPWSCDDRGGRIDRILAGTNRKISVLGWDNNRKNILYQGHTDTGISIIPGEITDVGTIVAHSFIPSGLEATTSSNSRISLVWNDFGGDYEVSGYRIYRDSIAIATSDVPSHEDNNLNPGIQYCYTIAAYDVFGHESGQCVANCATTEPSVDDVDNDGDGYSEVQGDCDDANAEINPDAAETCNGIDDNCAGGIDEGLSTDADGDGHYTPSSCALPADDCDDTSGSVYSGATEICGDDIDQDCSGEDLSCDNVDNDGDGYSEVQGDCDDANADVNPDAVEVCNGINDNCTGGIDEGLSTDADGDRHYTPGSCLTPADDCDDTRASVYPGATETCNGIDDNCAGGIDERLSRPTSCGVGVCADNTGTATCSDGVWGNDTCDPLAGATAETCDGVDNDCDGTVDEELSRPTSCGEGACTNNTGTATCSEGHWNDTCDPLAGATAEACDNVDNDCDGTVDEGLSQSTTCGEGACANNTGTSTCIAGSWDDTCDPYAGATTETCDDVDNDCDGTVDEGCPGCYPNLETPTLQLTRIERAPIEIAAFYHYFFTVTNWAQYPDEIFTQSSAYPSCNDEVESRSIVRIYDNEHNLISEFCDFASSDALESFYFTAMNGPQAVYIQIYDQECNVTYSSNMTVTSSPVQISPQNGTVFDHYPRTTTLRWNTVAGASSYSVEVDCYHCCVADNWCTDVGEEWSTYTGVRDNTYTFNFVGAQPGRWRVWAIDSVGNAGTRSEWWEFEYLR
jgi:hypothetical protein